MSNPLIKETAIATAKTACCTIIGLAGGHFGMLFLGALGAAGTVAASDPIRKTLELATEKASEIAAEVGMVTLAERERNDPIERIFQQALRQSLQQIRSSLPSLSVAGDRAVTGEMMDWFDNWDRALDAFVIDDFDKILITSSTQEESDRCLRETLTLLYAQGRRLDRKRKPASTDRIITYHPDELKEPLPALIALLKGHLPNVLPPIFDELLTAERNNQANKLYVNRFIDSFSRVYGPAIQEIKKTVDAIDIRTTKIDVGVATANEKLDVLLAREPKGAPDPTTSLRKPFNLPFSTLGNLFKGRDHDLDTLGHQLQVHGATAIVQPASITGMGGIGKTRLAIEYALRHQDDFSALLFVSANTRLELETNFALLSGPDVLKLPEYATGRQPEQYQAVLQWLQAHSGWLLVLDNVDTKEAVSAVQKLISRLPGGQVLITSRIAEWGSEVRAFGLDLLSEEAATSYLLEKTTARRRSQADDEAEVRSLAQDLGRLALALEQAAAYVNARGISIAEYRRRWQGNSEKLIRFQDDQAMQYTKTVAVTFLTSFEQLSPNGRRLLNLLAWLAPDPIQRTLLEARGGPFAAENDEDLPKEHWPDTQEEAEEALSDLVRFSLASWSTDKISFSVHRLVQTVTRHNQTGEEQYQFVAAALRWVNAGFPYDANDVRFWPLAEAVASHARVVTEGADHRKIAKPTARLMSQLGIFYQSRAEWSQAEPLYRRALAIDEKSYGLDHPEVATVLNNLAGLLQKTNRLDEAEPLYRRALAIDEKSYGLDHPVVAIRLNNLARLLQETNRLDEAEPLYRRALAIDEKSYGLDHPVVATDLNNLAGLLQETNRLDEAEPLMHRELEIFFKFTRMTGRPHTHLKAAIGNYAHLLEKMGISEEQILARLRELATEFFK